MVPYPHFCSQRASALWVVERGGMLSPTWFSCVARQLPIWSAKQEHGLTIAWGIPMPQVLENCFLLRFETVLVN